MTTNHVPNYSCTPQSILERVRYFPRQLVTAADMIVEQEYFQEKLRRHNRYLHGWGVVCGCEVKPNPEAGPWCIKVCPGYLLTPQGDEVEIPRAVDLDLAGDWRQVYDPCAQPAPCSSVGPSTTSQAQTVYLAVCHTECSSRPVRIHPAGCGCDETACEYSRVQESFELVKLLDLPESHKKTAEAEQRWVQQIIPWLAGEADGPTPIPECLQFPGDPCVVIATITLPGDHETAIDDAGISLDDRRICWGTQALFAAVKGRLINT